MTFVSRRYYRPRSERQYQETRRPNSRLFPAWNALITDAITEGATLTLLFDRAVILRSTPRPTGILTDVNETEVSVAQTAVDTVVITYTGNIEAAVEVRLPNPPTNAIRTRDGGWTQSGVFPIPVT